MNKQEKYPFVKEDHVEIGAETLVFSTTCCPLTEEEAENEECIVEVNKKRIPVCRCEELYCKYDENRKKSSYNILCSNFYLVVNNKIRCTLLSETDAVDIIKK